MIISHSKKFIFIRPKKIAGNSVSMWLRKFLERGDEDYSFIGRSEGKKFYNHASISDLITLEPELFQKYYTFTILRHPFDRMISEYYYSWDWDFKSFLKSPHAQGTRNEPLVTWKGIVGDFDKIVFYERLIEGLKEVASNLSLPEPTEASFPQEATEYRQDRSPWWEFMGKEDVEIAKKYLSQEIEFHKNLGYEIKKEGF